MSIPTPLRHRAALGALVALAATASAQAQIIVRPQVLIAPPAVVVPQPVYVAPQPVYVAPQPVYMAPQPVYGAPPPDVGYAPGPLDAIILGAAVADIVFLNGDTYIWAVDANGHRYRRFYAHGDHRADVMRHREDLHRIAARNGGRLPGPGENRGGRAEAARQHAEARPQAEARQHAEARPQGGRGGEREEKR